MKNDELKINWPLAIVANIVVISIVIVPFILAVVITMLAMLVGSLISR